MLLVDDNRLYTAIWRMSHDDHHDISDRAKRASERERESKQLTRTRDVEGGRGSFSRLFASLSRRSVEDMWRT